MRDVDRVIAHPFEIVGDFHRRGEKPQIAGHRLLRREQADHRLFDLQLEMIDLPVALNDLRGFFAVSLQHGLDRRREGCLRLARHVEQGDLELRELVVEMAMTRRLCVHPNLPVM